MRRCFLNFSSFEELFPYIFRTFKVSNCRAQPFNIFPKTGSNNIPDKNLWKLICKVLKLSQAQKVGKTN